MTKKSVCLLQFLKTILKLLFYSGLIVLFSIGVQAQTKDDLIKKKTNLLKEIKITETQLAQQSREKGSILTTIATLNAQIKTRKKLIQNTQNQVSLSKKEEKKIIAQKEEIEEEQKEIKEEYIRILKTAYKFAKTETKWLYILSSSNLNNAIRRYVYFRQFDNKRKANYQKLVDINKVLLVKQEEINAELIEQENLLTELEQEQDRLEDNQSEQKELLDIAKSREDELKKELKTQNSARNKLDDAIKKIIADEIARKKSLEDKKSTIDRSESAELSKNFSSNRGKLPWPVSTGFILRKFGKQAHPTIPGITIENNGIEISTEPGSEVKSIFDGEVIGVISVPGYQEMIIIRHGSYYTVYSRVSDVMVTKGEKVFTGTTLGTVHTKNTETILHLEIWKEKEKLDPSHWIKK